LDNNTQAFLALLRGGLWEKDVRLSKFEPIDYPRVLSLAEEQSVVGIVAAGLEHVVDNKPPKEVLLQFIGQTLQIEQRNAAMNSFIEELVDGMRKNDIYALLVKGQGVAQCYERPQWRSSGDIDFLFSKDNYCKAVDFFKARYSNNKNGGEYSKETAFYTDQWMIEVHGSLRTCLSSRVDKVIDLVQKDLFYGGNVRSWHNGKILTFLPEPTDDVFLVFTHYIKHFYKEGMSLRQVCDWCRLLWKYRDQIDSLVLEARIKNAGLLDEWRAFAAVAIEYLGMPVETMPMYSADKKWIRKAEKIVSYILMGGEWQKIKDTIKVGGIFPMSTLHFLPGILWNVNLLKIKEWL
jgi:hypothetical protein